MTHHRQLGHVDIAEIRHHFEGGDEVEIALALIDTRVAGQTQRMLAHCRIEGLTQQAFHRLGTHLLTEALLDDLGGHLARAETLDACGPRKFAQAATDMRLQALLRQGEGQAAFQIAGGFDRCLHVDSCHRLHKRRHEMEDAG